MNVCFICRELGAVILTLLGGRVNIVRIHSHVLPPTQQHMKLEQYIINYQKKYSKVRTKKGQSCLQAFTFLRACFLYTYTHVYFPLSHHSRKHFYHAWTGLMIHPDVVKTIKE